MRRLLIATALLLVVPLAAAQAYKWKDANGTVHYSDSPPPQGTKYNKVTTTGSVEPLAASTQDSSSDTGDSSTKANLPQPMPDTPQNRTKLCNSLKANMDALKSTGPVVIDEGGQQKVMSADQRKAQQDSTQAQYQQYCPGG